MCIDSLKVSLDVSLLVDMIESLQDDCDSTLHIVTETCGKLQHCEEMAPNIAKRCKMCKELDHIALLTVGGVMRMCAVDVVF